MRRRNPVGDHLRSNFGFISRPGIICGPIWGSFPVRGSFAGRDHLRACTNFTSVKTGFQLLYPLLIGLSGTIYCHMQSDRISLNIKKLFKLNDSIGVFLNIRLRTRDAVTELSELSVSREGTVCSI